MPQQQQQEVLTSIELVTGILSFLDTRDLCLAARVSSSWKYRTHLLPGTHRFCASQHLAGPNSLLWRRQIALKVPTTQRIVER